MKYHVTHSTVINGVLLLGLQPKYGSRLRFQGGQYVALSFNRRGRPTPSRCFSVISRPEADELRFAVRVLGDFTRRLSELPVGETVEVQGPFGEAVVGSDDREVIMLAAGIGITPMLGLLQDPAVRSGRVKATLVYSSHSAAQVILARDVWQAAQTPNVQVHWVFSSGDLPSGLTAQSGRLTESKLDAVLTGGYIGRRYVVCGPSDYTNRFVAHLRQQGVADADILTESFTQVIRLRQGRAVPRLVYSLTAVALLAGFGGLAAVTALRSPTATATQSTTSQSAATGSTAAGDATGTSNDTASSAGMTTTDSTAGGTADSSDASSSEAIQTYQQPVSSVS